ncbi:site-specific integrase [Pseudonocardia sp. MH-G8]|uniref:tyrosine-type recombinase/integrase n=1 Tax=Pseudonocardia sp. MH-G8 TaxID=1854588 RepID=UPI000BA100A2|nr:site-specific integrase [Pseudonocardia sp. MH-G8]OZM75373.1 integrase [Pseudonocardia sp. MH-G8]
MRRVAAGPVGVALNGDVEYRAGRPKPFKARVRWSDPATGKRPSRSESFDSREAADGWIDELQRLARAGVHPETATMSLAEYGESVMHLATRRLEPKTLDPYMAGWRLRVKPTLGHLSPAMITHGAVDRAVEAWIADGHGRSTIKNSLAVLVKVLEQARRDGLIDRNPAKVTGWQHAFQKAYDELENPRSLALADWTALTTLADALVARSSGRYRGWGDVVRFEACTASRIGEVSGCRVEDIDTRRWLWTVRRQTTPGPGGLMDKRTKGKRARIVPIIHEIRPLVLERIDAVEGRPGARLFTGPRGGRITTAILRDATHWDEVVVTLGYEHLRRHDLRHTGLTWMADAGVPVHVLRVIAGHSSVKTTQLYVHSDWSHIVAAGDSLTAYLGQWSPTGPQAGSA